jgi:uncharacterized protein YoxC
MSLLSISLLIFSVSILFFTIISIIWWKKYGKTLFFMLKDLKNTTNQENFLKNTPNFNEMIQKMSEFGVPMGDFTSRMDKIYKNWSKNK